jgi:hypothetical protein
MIHGRSAARSRPRTKLTIEPDPEPEPDRDSPSREGGGELTHTRGEDAFASVAASARTVVQPGTSPEGEPEETTEARGEFAFSPGMWSARGRQAALSDPQPDPPPPPPPPPRRPIGPDESKVRGEVAWDSATASVSVAVGRGPVTLLGELHGRQRTVNTIRRGER